MIHFYATYKNWATYFYFGKFYLTSWIGLEGHGWKLKPWKERGPLKVFSAWSDFNDRPSQSFRGHLSPRKSNPLASCRNPHFVLDEASLTLCIHRRYLHRHKQFMRQGLFIYTRKDTHTLSHSHTHRLTQRVK